MGPLFHKQVSAIIFKRKHRIHKKAVDRGWPKRNVLESNKETTSDYTGRKHGYLGGTQAVWITQNGFLSSTIFDLQPTV